MFKFSSGLAKLNSYLISRLCPIAATAAAATSMSEFVEAQKFTRPELGICRQCRDTAAVSFQYFKINEALLFHEVK